MLLLLLLLLLKSADCRVQMSVGVTRRGMLFLL